MDPIGLAVASAGAGMAAGLAVISSTVVAVGMIRSPSAAPTPDLGAPLVLLLAGTFGGLLLAGVITWQLLARIASTYRRGGLALVSSFATVILMLVTMPLNQAAGRGGLLGLAAGAAGVGLLLARR
ncbi:MAG: hypothetical protein ACJ8DJ_19840, partial [Gemmatimonadales bacterium]